MPGKRGAVFFNSARFWELPLARSLGVQLTLSPEQVAPRNLAKPVLSLYIHVLWLAAQGSTRS